MEEGIRARPRVKVCLARPPQGKNRRRGPRPKSNPGRTGRGHPRTNGWGGGRSDRPKGGKGRARPPQEKRRRGQRPNSNARTSWRNHPRQKWRRKPGQAQRKGWDTTGTPAEEEERQNAKGPAQVSRAVLEEEGPPKMAAWAMGITPQPNPEVGGGRGAHIYLHG